MSLDIEPIGKTFGARVRGVDFSQDLDAATLEEVRQAWLERRVLAFPDQHLSEPKLLEFSRLFGPLERHVRSEYHHERYPEILMLSTVVEAGQPKGLADAGSYWHSDVSYKAQPSRGSALYAIEVPAEGGDTLFCDMVAAYEALDEATRARIDGLTAIHSYEYRTNLQVSKLGLRKPLSEEQKRQTPDVEHPVVRIQPETGRKSLFVNPGFTTRIIGLSDAESDDLLNRLFDHCQQDRFQLRYRWSKGDLLTWDNAVTMHCATVTELPAGTRRTMWRTVIGGDRPLGAAA